MINRAGIEDKRITTVVADDSPSFRYGFCHYLRTDARTCIVGTAGNGFEAIELVRRTRPQLVVMDYHMPGPPGDRAAAWIAEHFPETRVLLVSADEHLEGAPCRSRGACAYMCKSDLLFALPPLLARWFPLLGSPVADARNPQSDGQNAQFPPPGEISKAPEQ